MHTILGYVLLLLASLGAHATPAPITTSAFSTGFEGWTFTSGMTWQSSGGNPGGYLQFDESGPPTGGRVFAPPAFHGDWSAFVGGTFSYDYEVLATGTSNFDRLVEISNSSNSAYILTPKTGGVFTWTNFSVPILQSAWTITSGNWSNLISNVTSVKIDLSDDTFAIERTGLDNVMLAAPVSEPGTAILALAALAALGSVRRSGRNGRASADG